MSVSAAANALILASVIAKSIDNIDVISIQDAGGEVFRKAYQSVDTVSATERKYTFYLTEDEGNTTIIGLSLYGNGATTALGNGTEMCTQILNIEKTNTQSLLVYWTVKVVQ
jgi:hypothetical protein